MFLKSNISKLLMVIVAFIIFSPAANARHLKLYTYDVLEKGQTSITYNLDIVDGPGGNRNAGRPILHEIEIEYGITSKWTQSFYIDYDFLSNNVNEVSSLKTEINYAFSEKGKNFVDFRLNVEYAVAINNNVNAFGDTNTPDTIEFRPIFEKNFDTFSLVFGPILSKDLSAPNNAKLGDWNLGFANAFMIDLDERTAFNLEFHSFLGEDRNLGFVNRQSHYLVPNINYNVMKGMTLSVGAGIGLTAPSDDFTFRSSLAYKF